MCEDYVVSTTQPLTAAQQRTWRLGGHSYGGENPGQRFWPMMGYVNDKVDDGGGSDDAVPVLLVHAHPVLVSKSESAHCWLKGWGIWMRPIHPYISGKEKAPPKKSQTWTLFSFCGQIEMRRSVYRPQCILYRWLETLWVSLGWWGRGS